MRIIIEDRSKDADVDEDIVEISMPEDDCLAEEGVLEIQLHRYSDDAAICVSLWGLKAAIAALEDVLNG